MRDNKSNRKFGPPANGNKGEKKREGAPSAERLD